MCEEKYRIEGECLEEIDCKRFYLKGIKAYSYCPKCNQERKLDFSQDYISYLRQTKFRVCNFGHWPSLEIFQVTSGETGTTQNITEKAKTHE